jgi:hypothetical protein
LNVQWTCASLVDSLSGLHLTSEKVPQVDGPVPQSAMPLELASKCASADSLSFWLTAANHDNAVALGESIESDVPLASDHPDAESPVSYGDGLADPELQPAARISSPAIADVATARFASTPEVNQTAVQRGVESFGRDRD